MLDFIKKNHDGPSSPTLPYYMKKIQLYKNMHNKQIIWFKVDGKF